MKKNPYQSYKQQSILTMTPSEMLTALYDGLLKELARAQNGFAAKDYSQVNQSLQKVQLILRHLQNTLDFQYEISNNLYALYDYFLHTALQANLKKDPTELDSIIEMIHELRDTYIQADKKSRLAKAIG